MLPSLNIIFRNYTFNINFNFNINSNINMFLTLWLCPLIAFGYLVATTLTGRKRYPLPLPPGPKQKPIIGNLKDLPSPDQQDWMHWLKFKELYGKAEFM